MYSTMMFLAVSLVLFLNISLVACQRNPPCHICFDDGASTITIPEAVVQLPSFLGVPEATCDELRIAAEEQLIIPTSLCPQLDMPGLRAACGCEPQLESDGPSNVPSDAPSMVPSDAPSLVPSDMPSTLPSVIPTVSATAVSTEATEAALEPDATTTDENFDTTNLASGEIRRHGGMNVCIIVGLLLSLASDWVN